MKNKYVFILSITVVCSLLLSFVSEVLKSKTLENMKFDKKKNVLSAAGVKNSSGESANLWLKDDIDSYFSDYIKEILIKIDSDDYKRYTIDSNLQIVDLIEEENMQTGEVKYYYTYESIKYEYLPLYQDEKENVIILPISGKGLWSTLFGYFAIDSNDYSTVKGITFYKHKETPGLGGEVEADWFKKQFIQNKKIYDVDNELSSITVTKAGKVIPNDPHQVDGISGATITSKGVSDFLLRDLKKYQHYFESNK